MRFMQLLLPVIITCTSALFTTSAYSQQTGDTAINAEIRTALQTWNETTASRNTNAFLNLYDNTSEILLIGSDSAEIYKGKTAIEHWISLLFKHNSFSWIMNRIDIDHHGKTAWVFVEGFMVVKSDAGWTNKTPYRFTGIMIRKKDGWKWRFFNGSIPRGH